MKHAPIGVPYSAIAEAYSCAVYDVLRAMGHAN